MPTCLPSTAATLRDAWRRHEGVEVDTQGDAFFVAFARASDAVAAAIDAQHALAGGPVRVRMGLHTGEPPGRRGLRRARRAPGGADRGCWARRAGAALAGDGRPRRRRCARPRPAPAEGPERAGAPLPARDGGLPAAEDAARDEPAGSGDAVSRSRAGDRTDRSAAAAPRRPAGDADRALAEAARRGSRCRLPARLPTTTTEGSGGCRSPRSPIPHSSRRPPLRRSGRRTSSLQRSPTSACCSCWTTSSICSTQPLESQRRSNCVRS